MKRKIATHIPTAKRLLNQIGSRYAFSSETMLAFAVPAFASALVFESTRLQEPLFLRLLFALIGYLATLAVMAIARLYFPNQSRLSRPGWVISIFALAGLVRGLVLTALSYFTIGISLDQILYRILGGPIFTMVMLTLCTVLVANNLRHKDALRQLAIQRHKLEVRSASDLARVETQRDELVSRVQEILSPAFSRIQKNLESPSHSSSKAIESMKATVDKVIRPLSLELASEVDEIREVDLLKVFSERTPLPSKIYLGDFLLPFFGALVSAATIIPSAFWIEEPLHASILVALAFALVLLGVGFFWLTTRKLLLPTGLVAAIVPVIYGITPAAFLLVSPTFGFATSAIQIYSYMVFVGAIGFTFFAAQIRQMQREETLKRFNKVNLEIEILNSALRQQLWLNRRRTAAILHGPIQSALYASAIKLSQAEKATDGLIAEVEEDIRLALTKLDNPTTFTTDSLSQGLDQVLDIWADVAKINLNFPEQLLKRVSKNLLASEATLEVIQEFVTNAIKHGNATTIDVSVNQIDSKRLGVSVSDNGQGLAAERGSGFGSKLLGELTLVWKLDRVGDTTVAYAEIVIGRDNL